MLATTFQLVALNSQRVLNFAASMIQVREPLKVSGGGICPGCR